MSARRRPHDGARLSWTPRRPSNWSPTTWRRAGVLVSEGDPRQAVESLRSDRLGVTVPRADHGVRRESQEYIAHPPMMVRKFGYERSTKPPRRVSPVKTVSRPGACGEIAPRAQPGQLDAGHGQAAFCHPPSRGFRSGCVCFHSNRSSRCSRKRASVHAARTGAASNTGVHLLHSPCLRPVPSTFSAGI